MAVPDLPPAATAMGKLRDGFFLSRASFADLPGFAEDDHLGVFRAFSRSCAAIAAKMPPLRGAVSVSPALEAIAQEALQQSVCGVSEARRFFETRFAPCRILPGPAQADAGAFVTGYYEPIVEGSLTRTAEFTAPVLGRPAHLRTGTPYFDRAAIDAGAAGGDTAALLWLHDAVEAFLVQVQGSGKVRLADGRVMRLVYAGRNGHPYTSIGRILTETGQIPESAMSLAALKQWIRANGQNPGDAGRALMQRNKSYVFFSAQEDDGSARGPTGGQGIELSALRSLAIDRSIWSYGLPFWISACLPWASPFPSPFRRLMVAQDTGSAITGPARFDIFFGSGDDAGARAGDIRHKATTYVLLPVDDAPDT